MMTIMMLIKICGVNDDVFSWCRCFLWWCYIIIMMRMMMMRVLTV